MNSNRNPLELSLPPQCSPAAAGATSDGAAHAEHIANGTVSSSQHTGRDEPNLFALLINGKKKR
jgi:hypothetical protein